MLLYGKHLASLVKKTALCSFKRTEHIFLAVNILQQSTLDAVNFVSF